MFVFHPDWGGWWILLGVPLLVVFYAVVFGVVNDKEPSTGVGPPSTAYDDGCDGGGC